MSFLPGYIHSMSKLVPEKRVDKNGVLTTKHVKVVSEKDAFKGSVPAPALVMGNPKRNLTPKQTSPINRAFSSTGYFVDQRLKDILCDTDSNVRWEFEISDEDMYSVLGVTDPGTGIALMNAGYKTADEASRFLKDNGLDELLEDHVHFCNEALDRRISPQTYLGALDFFPYLGETDRDMDALEVYSYGAIRSTFIYNDVYHGETRLEDVKIIGVTRIADSRHPGTIRDALRRLGSGEAGYTAEDIRTLTEKFPNNTHELRSAIGIADRYGMEFAMSLHMPDIQTADYLEETGTDRERLLDIVRYDDQVTKYQRDNSIISESQAYEYIVKAYDAKLSIADAAENLYTIQQIDALMNGVEKSVSGGWL